MMGLLTTLISSRETMLLMLPGNTSRLLLLRSIALNFLKHHKCPFLQALVNKIKHSKAYLLSK